MTRDLERDNIGSSGTNDRAANRQITLTEEQRDRRKEGQRGRTLNGGFQGERKPPRRLMVGVVQARPSAPHIEAKT